MDCGTLLRGRKVILVSLLLKNDCLFLMVGLAAEVEVDILVTVLVGCCEGEKGLGGAALPD